MGVRFLREDISLVSWKKLREFKELKGNDTGSC